MPKKKFPKSVFGLPDAQDNFEKLARKLAKRREKALKKAAKKAQKKKK